MWRFLKIRIHFKILLTAAGVSCAYVFFLVVFHSQSTFEHSTKGLTNTIALPFFPVKNSISQPLSSQSINQSNAVKPLITAKPTLKEKFKPEQQSNSLNNYTIHPWRKDTECQDFTVQLPPKNSLPKWALASFPGSGVTWTRQMIEGITGIYTGSNHYQDPSPIKTDEMTESSGITDDPFCDCTIIDKEHEATITTNGLTDYFRLLYVEGYFDHLRDLYGGRSVILLRNPMDVVFTFRNWQLAGKTGYAPPEAFKGQDWNKIVNYVTFAWADHAIRWIEGTKKGTVIFYENLLGEDADRELERFWKAMEFKEPMNPDRLRCTLAHRNRTDHKRIHKARMTLDEDQRQGFMKSIHKVQLSLRRRKWPLLPVHLYDFHSSDSL